MDVTTRIRLRTALSAMRTVLVWAGVAILPLLWVMAPAAATTGNGIGVLGWWLPERYLVPLLIVALPAALLRRRPLTGLGLMLVGATLTSVTVHGGDQGYLGRLFTVQFLAVDAALGVVAANRSRRVSGLAAVVVLGTQILVAFVNSGVEPVDQALLSGLAVATAWTLGNSVRSRREHATALRAHAAAEAVTAERLRIARELHDVVAHSIGVIAIQAGVGARVIDTQPVQARAALRTIEATSRDTLAELRRTLGALRRGVGESAPLDPTPGLADLDRLVVATADAGVRVELRRHGARPVPPEVDLAAFRIVQESLTNVVRHAEVDACRVSVRCDPDSVVVEVVDEGRGGRIGAAGHGLIGMRERVQALGGRFHAGPRPEGGFRVTARLPLSVPTGADQPIDGDRPTDGELPIDGELPGAAVGR
ncbi:sensor histidine kinase [Micromonospora fiedleri]|uniref:histidine kinase n=1 Tax=Micromonospora fiedleri TaxID=1157498 RepID=A0ABS1UH74_9ACTN|nr:MULTISPECIES: histidine kinase [Micromonospora]MBL6275697.1 sensor histidine kinase [Micromonospora fiedleri]WSK41813.1 histidine kinase [Micromonospora maris]